jgi:hypothetical protein
MQVLIHANSDVNISGRRWYYMLKPILMRVNTNVNVLGMEVLTYAITGVDVCRNAGVGIYYYRSCM